MWSRFIPPMRKTRQNWGKIANYPPPNAQERSAPLAVNHFLVHPSPKNSLRNAKNVVFFLFCNLVDRPIRRATAPPPTPRPHWLRYWFHASILLLIAVELVRLWCIHFISVKLFGCYNGSLVRCVDTCWCHLKGDINCNYDYYYYDCSSVQREQQYKTVKVQTRLLKIILYFFALVLFVLCSSWFTKHLVSWAKS